MRGIFTVEAAVVAGEHRSVLPICARADLSVAAQCRALGASRVQACGCAKAFDALETDFVDDVQLIAGAADQGEGVAANGAD